MSDTESPTLPGQRGRKDHAMREKIVDAAGVRFRREGFAKTTVAEVAADLDVTPAYVYKFFASKSAICEAVCAQVLRSIAEVLDRIVASRQPASLRLELLYVNLLKESIGQYFAERKLSDMVVSALEHRWSSVEQYKLALRTAVATVIAEGVAAGEFAAELDQAQATLAIWSSLFPFSHPAVLESTLHYDLDAHAQAAAAFALRALRP